MKIICIGRNYLEHAKELKNEVPGSPLIFMKPETSLMRGNRWEHPTFSKNVHYECEWVVRISKKAKNIDVKIALEHVDAMSLGIDFTARDIQTHLKSKAHPWELAKAFDQSAFVGEMLDFTSDDQNFQLYRNEVLVQNGNTKSMIFSLPYLIQYTSQFFTLNPGDLIFTGTPHGVGQVIRGDQFRALLNEQEVFNLNIV
jgi:2-keto-4-pentenoate hydratase/2-oxohepta-3-ene-1,7-dioic acid hydratase in catechol pathway